MEMSWSDKSTNKTSLVKGDKSVQFWLSLLILICVFLTALI